MTRDDLPVPDPLPPRRTSWALPAFRYVPGVHPHPSGLARHLPEVPADARVAYGLDLLGHGYAWEAHEVWEAPWHAWPDGPARDGLQGCIQAAATLLLRHLGREQAMHTQAERARAHLQVAIQAQARVDGMDLAAFKAAWEQALRTGGWPNLEDAWAGS